MGPRRPSALGHGVASAPAMRGRSRRGASDSSRCSLAEEPIAKSPAGRERAEVLGVRTVLLGPGSMSGRVLGAWGRFRPGKFWTFPSRGYAELRSAMSHRPVCTFCKFVTLFCF